MKDGFEITKKIKVIEQLKSQMLTNISKIYENMSTNEVMAEDNIDILADMIIISYLLTNELGTSYVGLDIKIKNKLKWALINESENTNWKKQLNLLSQYFNTNNN